MPPNLDIYCLSSRRDRATVNAFIAAQVDHETWRQRRDEELMVEPIGVEPDQIGFDDWEWIPVHEPEDVIRAGLSDPPRAFTVYLPSSHGDIDQAILCFTRDGLLVLGPSVDGEADAPETLGRAKQLLRELMERFDGIRGLIAVELPPARSADDFVVAMQHESTVLSWDVQGDPHQINRRELE